MSIILGDEDRRVMEAIEEIKRLLAKAEEISSGIQLFPLSAILCTILGVIYSGDVSSLMKLSEVVYEYTLIFKKELENAVKIESGTLLS